MPKLGKPGSGGWFTMGLLAAFPVYLKLPSFVAVIGMGIAMGALVWFVLKEGGRESQRPAAGPAFPTAAPR